MVFMAVLLSALVGTMGIAVEGGHVFIEYRRLQSAADMSALVGAQKLPCSTSNTSCQQSAETDGCTYATDNGFSGCATGATSAPYADVPPHTCSPYDWIDYGSQDSSCKSALTPQYYDYIEVAVSENLGTIPIFNIPITLTAHAVAKHGGAGGGDFGLINLSPTSPLTMTGNTTVQITGSVFSNGGINGSGTATATCDGGWLSAGSITNVTTDTTGTPIFSTTGCTGTNNTSPDQQPNLPQLNDPYAGSQSPPSQPSGTSFSNCAECSYPGIWYGLDASNAGWHVDTNNSTDPSGDAELFPGIYRNLTFKNTDSIYYNPGVYTITSSMDTNHGSMCVYGSPDCNDPSCLTTTFTPGSTTGDQWNYNCTPYGYWDSTLAGQVPPATLSQAGVAGLTQPTFYDSSTGTASTVPLNGVAFYLTANTSIIDHGNTGCGNCGSVVGSVMLAASNPCPGTGSYSAASGTYTVPEDGDTGSVSFPSGASTGQFNYSYASSGYTVAGTSSYSSANYSMPNGGATVSPSTVSLYPSVDWSLLAECHSSYVDWPGEFSAPQHLHFLFYLPNSSSSILMNGASGQQYTGLVYAPNSSITVEGAGKSGGGPPFVNGQVVGGTVTLKGNSYVDISYRPCGPGANGCGSNTDTQLVQ
jgi:hypothetical protein